MMARPTADAGAPPEASVLDRLAAGPISWGVCEVPGWGAELPPRRVLAEMRSLGIRATEAGPEGYLGTSGHEVAALLDEFGLRLVGGFVPLVLHAREGLSESMAAAARAARRLEEAGGEVLVSAAVADLDWSAPEPLSRAGWRRLCETLARLDELAEARGLVHALHPHLGTVVAAGEDVRQVLEGSDVRFCLDTGHLLLCGVEPLAFAVEAGERVVHVHLKDVAAGLAARVRAGELSHHEATRLGIFRPLGDGDAAIADVVSRLEEGGYKGWYVLEQDTALASPVLEPGAGPLEDQRRSIEFLRALTARVSPRKEGTE
jgi:inosose dehydratase